jgi:hypothetical protein
MRSLYLKLLSGLLIAIAFLIMVPLRGETLSLTAHARLLAGMPASDVDSSALPIEHSPQWIEAVKGQTAAYFWNLEEWGTRKNQLNKEMAKRGEIEHFLAHYLSEAYFNTRHVLYLFGGPDFCYPDLFFPNMENMIIIGQESIGVFPDVNQYLNRGILNERMLEVGTSFAQIPFRSYFVTQTMNQEFYDYGIGTMLAVSIVLAGYDLVDYQEIFLDKEGALQSKKTNSSIPGIKIMYKKDQDDKERAVYYFCMNLNQHKLLSRLIIFIEKMEIDTAFYKATSFATQSKELIPANQLALNHAKYIVQGESGIPYRDFNPDQWQIKLFGIYARPYYSTQNISPSWGLQKDLRDIYIALIYLSGSEKTMNIVKMIWEAKVCAKALNIPIPLHVTWEGILPMHFDYGGQLVEEQFKPYTSALQYAIKKS